MRTVHRERKLWGIREWAVVSHLSPERALAKRPRMLQRTQGFSNFFVKLLFSTPYAIHAS